MLHCLRPTPLTTTPNLHPFAPSLQGTSNEGTPCTSSQPSPTFNLTNEYAVAVHTNSYEEVWSKFHPGNSSSQEVESVQLDCPGEEEEEEEQFLQPNWECVEEALRDAKPSTFTRLVSAFFEQTEQASRLCVLLRQGVQRARSHYAPVHNLISVLPLDSESESLNQLQCDRAFNIFLQFDRLDNPFPDPDSHYFNDVRNCFSQLKQQLDSHLRKSRSKIQLIRRGTSGCAICLIGTVVGVAISAAVIASHALVALVASPVFFSFLPSKISKKELAQMAQLDAAARGTYLLHIDVDSIDRRVARLRAEIEGDKFSIRLGLERGSDRYVIQEVAKQLEKDRINVLRHLSDLEEHLCLCFAAINRARSLLLQEIHFHQYA